MREAFRTAMSKMDPTFIERGGREVLFTAQVEEATNEFATVDELLALLAKATPASALEGIKKAYNEAALSPVGDNGKPRMLKLTAWMAHAPKPNLNRDAFRESDLQKRVEEGLFQAPYNGMVDFNHDFNSYGAWYSAKYAFDAKAGQYGLLVEGYIFAWRYEELADKMLAMQQRLGHIAVSMACMPESVDMLHDEENQPYWLLINPVFFTCSVLDVDPADPFGRAQGSEDTNQSPAERENLLSTASLSESGPDLTMNTEVNMTLDELVGAFRKVVTEENQAQFAPMVEAFTRLPAVEAELATATESLTAATERATTAEARIVELETAATEASVANEATVAALATANEELVSLREFKATADAAEAEAARVAKREARLNELTADARTILATRDEETQEKLYSRWEAMEQAEWEIIRDSLNVAKVESTNKYEEATNKEGTLTGGTSEKSKTKFEIDRYVK